jgi:hypothetical protein
MDEERKGEKRNKEKAISGSRDAAFVSPWRHPQNGKILFNILDLIGCLLPLQINCGRSEKPQSPDHHADWSHQRD